jgi:tRNA (cmo5U34)-methyltransferase
MKNNFREVLMSIDQAFNNTTAYYDDWMKLALPNFHDLFQTAKDIIPFSPDAAIDVLDLGAGTGLFSQHVLERFPRANFVLVDVADKMLDVARQRFGGHTGQFRFVSGDYREMKPDIKFDLVISSLSIHHLSDEEKQALFKNAINWLRKPGVFINVDQVRGETEYIRSLYWNHWLEQLRQRQAPEERIQEGIQRRTTYDREATLDAQLTWLQNSGFSNVDCVYKNYFVAVMFAMKTD